MAQTRKMFLREWCESRGIIQARIVDHVDTDKSSVSKWWNNKIRPDYEHVDAIAKMLGIDPMLLYYHPSEQKVMEFLQTLTPEQKLKAKAVLEIYFDVPPVPPLPDDLSHLAKMKLALDEQSAVVGDVITARLAGKADPSLQMLPEVLSAARVATDVPRRREPPKVSKRRASRKMA